MSDYITKKEAVKQFKDKLNADNDKIVVKGGSGKMFEFTPADVLRKMNRKEYREILLKFISSVCKPKKEKSKIKLNQK